jgi:hypothetical protein
MVDIPHEIQGTGLNMSIILFDQFFTIRAKLLALLLWFTPFAQICSFYSKAKHDWYEKLFPIIIMFNNVATNMNKSLQWRSLCSL